MASSFAVGRCCRYAFILLLDIVLGIVALMAVAPAVASPVFFLRILAHGPAGPGLFEEALDLYADFTFALFDTLAIPYKWTGDMLYLFDPDCYSDGYSTCARGRYFASCYYAALVWNTWRPLILDFVIVMSVYLTLVSLIAGAREAVVAYVCGAETPTPP